MLCLFFHVYALAWCSFAVNLLVVTLQKKLSSGSHKVAWTENPTVGVISTSRLWGRGAHFIAFAPGAENPNYATVWELQLCRKVAGHLSEGSFVQNVVVQILKFDAKPNPKPNPNPDHSPNPSPN